MLIQVMSMTCYDDIPVLHKEVKEAINFPTDELMGHNVSQTLKAREDGILLHRLTIFSADEMGINSLHPNVQVTKQIREVRDY